MFELVEIIDGHDERVWHCSWSPNGKYLASCGEDKIIRIWAYEDSLQMKSVTDSYVDNSFTLNNNSSSTNTDKKNLSFTCISTLEEGQSRTIRSCEWAPNGKLIASASFDGTVVVWQAQDNSLRHWDQISSLEGHESEAKSVAWSSDGGWLASCGRDKKVWIWERVGGNDFECVTMLEGHTQDVKFIKWHPSTNLLFSASYDDTIKIWTEDNEDWYCVTTLVGHTSTVWGLSIDSTGQKLISCSDDQSIIMWEKTGQEWKNVVTLKNLHAYPIYSVDWSHGFNAIVTAGGDNAIAILKPVRNDDGSYVLNTEYVKKESHDGDVNCVRWNPDVDNKTIIASCSDDSYIKIWRFNQR